MKQVLKGSKVAKKSKTSKGSKVAKKSKTSKGSKVTKKSKTSKGSKMVKNVEQKVFDSGEDELSNDLNDKNLFIDMCRTLKDFQSSELNKINSAVIKRTFVPVTSQNVVSRSTFHLEDQQIYATSLKIFELNENNKFFLEKKPIAQGNSGKIFRGRFGTGVATMQKSVIKINTEGDAKTDLMELLIQTHLFCEFRSMAAMTALQQGSAKIPKPLFGAELNQQRIIGMQYVDETCRSYLKPRHNETSDAHFQRFLHVAKAVCNCLHFLQTNFNFVHGDLHLGNVMITHVPFRVYLIDFGRSACDMMGKRRYADPEFPWKRSPSVDLLVFYTEVVELVKKSFTAHQYCEYETNKVYDQILKPKLKDVPSKFKVFRDYYNANTSEQKWAMFTVADVLFEYEQYNLVPNIALERLNIVSS